MKRIPVIMIFLSLVLYGARRKIPPSDQRWRGSLHQAVGRLAPGKMPTSVTDTACSPMRS